MSMSTHVYGIRPPDDNWKKMYAIWKACKSGSVDIPEVVLDFFDSGNPDPKGVVLTLDRAENGCCAAYNDEYSSGFEADLTQIPKDIKILRFARSW